MNLSILHKIHSKFSSAPSNCLKQTKIPPLCHPFVFPLLRMHELTNKFHVMSLFNQQFLVYYLFTVFFEYTRKKVVRHDVFKWNKKDGNFLFHHTNFFFSWGIFFRAFGVAIFFVFHIMFSSTLTCHFVLLS